MIDRACTSDRPCVRHGAMGVDERAPHQSDGPCGPLRLEDLGMLRYVALEARGAKDPSSYARGAAGAVLALVEQLGATLSRVHPPEPAPTCCARHMARCSGPCGFLTSADLDAMEDAAQDDGGLPGRAREVATYLRLLIPEARATIPPADHLTLAIQIPRALLGRSTAEIAEAVARVLEPSLLEMAKKQAPRPVEQPLVREGDAFTHADHPGARWLVLNIDGIICILAADSITGSRYATTVELLDPAGPWKRDDGVMSAEERETLLVSYREQSGWSDADLVARAERGEPLEPWHVGWLVLLGRGDLLDRCPCGTPNGTHSTTCEKLSIFPCGCSRMKVRSGLCDLYKRDGTPRGASEVREGGQPVSDTDRKEVRHVAPVVHTPAAEEPGS